MKIIDAFMRPAKGRDPESPVLPARGAFPAGIRTTIVPVDGTNWEVIYHELPDNVKLYTIRHLDDHDAVQAAFQSTPEELGLLVTEWGSLLHPKKVEALRAGRWLDGCEPNTYLTAEDAGGAEIYLLRYDELIRQLLAGAAQAKAAQEPANAATPIPPPTDTPAADGA